MLLGLSGFAGVGKDTLADLLIKRDNFNRLSFADNVRLYAETINPTINVGKTGYLPMTLKDLVDKIGWEAAKRQYPEIRELIINIGHGMRELFDYDFWIKQASPSNVPAFYKIHNYVIADVRYENEYKFIKDMAGIHVRIEREGINAPFDHVTERVLKSDYIVKNVNGNMENMYNEIREILDGLSWHTNTGPKTTY